MKRSVKKLFLIIFIPVLCLLSLLALYLTTPFMYIGKFDISFFEDEGVFEVEKNPENRETNSGECNIFEVYAIAKSEVYRRTYLRNKHYYGYKIRFNSEKRIWRVDAFNRMMIFDNVLFEGFTVLIDEHGNVLCTYIGAP